MTETELQPRALPQWSTLIGHDRVKQWFGNAIRSGRLAGSFLLVGSPGIGKRTIARLLAQTLLCESVEPAQMAPCGSCESCIQVRAGTHSDLISLSKPKDRTFIPMELLVGPPDARMQEGFCRDIRLRPSRGGRRVAILQDADDLNEEGANCLLKTLEEPPATALILLIGTSEQRQLPTIRSRCRIVRLGPLSAGDAARLLREAHGIEATDDRITEAIEVSGGDLQAAARLLSDQTGKLHQSLSSQLSATNPEPVALVRVITAHVDEAGKEASKRRGAMRDVFSISVQHYRRQLRQEAFDSNSQPSTLARLDRSVRALREVDRSANQSTLIECFAADIALGVTGDRGEIG